MLQTDPGNKTTSGLALAMRLALNGRDGGCEGKSNHQEMKTPGFGDGANFPCMLLSERDKIRQRKTSGGSENG